MLAGFQRGERGSGVAVKLLEEGVHGRGRLGVTVGSGAARVEGIKWRRAAIAQAPQ